MMEKGATTTLPLDCISFYTKQSIKPQQQIVWLSTKYRTEIYSGSSLLSFLICMAFTLQTGSIRSVRKRTLKRNK